MRHAPRTPGPEVVSAVRPVDPAWARRLKIPETEIAEVAPWDAVPSTARVSVRPPRVAAMRVEDTWLETRLAEDDRWIVAYRLTAQTGAVVIAEIRLFPHEDTRPDGEAGEWSAQVLGGRAPVPPGGVYAQLVRFVKTGEHQRYANAELRRLAGAGGVIGDSLARQGVAAPRRRTGGGRPRKADFYFAEIARDYVQAIDRGSKRPAKDVAEARGLAQGAVRDALATARERGLLTKIQQGKWGGDLTAKCLALLGERRGADPHGGAARVPRAQVMRSSPKRARGRPHVLFGPGAYADAVRGLLADGKPHYRAEINSALRMVIPPEIASRTEIARRRLGRRAPPVRDQDIPKLVNSGYARIAGSTLRDLEARGEVVREQGAEGKEMWRLRRGERRANTSTTRRQAAARRRPQPKRRKGR